MSRSGILILTYHSIDAAPPSGLPFRSLHVHPQRFKSQMLWLKRLGYRGVSMRDARPYLEGKKQGKIVVITFDDGYFNVYQHAMPVLNALNFTATNYFVANQIGGRNEWDIPKGSIAIPCMTKAQLLEWASHGHEVGAHTLDHIFLPDAEKNEAQRQITGCKLALENILGAEVSNFCYPHGGETPAIRNMVEKAGYIHATTTKKGLAKTSDDPFGLPRRFIRKSDNSLFYLKKVFGY